MLAASLPRHSELRGGFGTFLTETMHLFLRHSERGPDDRQRRHRMPLIIENGRRNRADSVLDLDRGAQPLPLHLDGDARRHDRGLAS